MGDSDDDREFRRRDKFHTERRGYEGGGSGLPRGEWREPRPLPPPSYAYRGRPAYGGGGARDRYSPEPRGRRHHEMSPPPKRMRGGWEDDRFVSCQLGQIVRQVVSCCDFGRFTVG
jgi:hypothetical protein